MVPPQLALFAAKYGKQIAIGLFALVVISCIYFAVKMHERTIEKLAESEAARASQVVAHAVTAASLENQKQAAAEWQASAEEYKRTLETQERVRTEARAYGEKLNETFQDHDFAKLVAAKPGLIERIVNRGTARIVRLLNCSSTPSGCPGDRGAARSDTGNPLSAAPRARDVRVDGDGPRLLPRSRPDVSVPRPKRVRSSKPK